MDDPGKIRFGHLQPLRDRCRPPLRRMRDHHEDRTDRHRGGRSDRILDRRVHRTGQQHINDIGTVAGDLADVVAVDHCGDHRRTGATGDPTDHGLPDDGAHRGATWLTRHPSAPCVRTIATTMLRSGCAPSSVVTFCVTVNSLAAEVDVSAGAPVSDACRTSSGPTVRRASWAVSSSQSAPGPLIGGNDRIDFASRSSRSGTARTRASYGLTSTVVSQLYQTSATAWATASGLCRSTPATCGGSADGAARGVDGGVPGIREVVSVGTTNGLVEVGVPTSSDGVEDSPPHAATTMPAAAIVIASRRAGATW
ncbi:hypothetical protein Pd630_LPD10016 (plasmid) [Rhodococcus opacus PD630]|nr:hypothetical protein Pd630_LPD10016 [Rhodococcus opacus PD630]